MIRSKTYGVTVRTSGLAALAALLLLGAFSSAALAAPPVNTLPPAITPATPEVGKSATASTGTWTSEAPAHWLAGTEALKAGEKVSVTPSSTSFHYGATVAGAYGELDCKTTITGASLENPSGGGSGVGNAELKYPGCVATYTWSKCLVTTEPGSVPVKFELTNVDGKAKITPTGANLGTFTLYGSECGAMAGTVLKLVGTIEGRFANAYPRIEFNPETSGTGALRYTSKTGPKVTASGAVSFKTGAGVDIKTNTIAYSYAWSRCTTVSCSKISGATASSYTPDEADWGMKLKATVTATDANGSTAVDSAQSNTVIGNPRWFVSSSPGSWLQPTTAPFSAKAESPVTISWLWGANQYVLYCYQASGEGTLSNTGAASSATTGLTLGDCHFVTPGPATECEITTTGTPHSLTFKPLVAEVKNKATRPELTFNPASGTVLAEFQLTGCAVAGTYQFTGWFQATFNNAASSIETGQYDIRATGSMKFQGVYAAGIDSRLNTLSEGTKPVKLGF